MQRTLSLIGSALLIASPGFAEILSTAPMYAGNSDVVLESAVREIKSVPKDTRSVGEDIVKYLKDESTGAANVVAAVLKGDDAHTNVKKSGKLAVVNAWDSSNDIIFRSYKVSAQIGDVLMTAAKGSEGPSVDVSAFFDDIKFSSKESAYYMPKFNQLMVRQTLANINAIEDVLAGYQQADHDLMGKQVEIEAKFVEVNQTTLDELGFSWNFGSKDGGDLRVLGDVYVPQNTSIFAAGLRTAASAINSGTTAGSLAVSKAVGSLQWDFIMTALEQSDDSDVLSAPRVVTLDGSTATIQVGQEQMMPKSFDVNDQNVSPWAEHQDWDLVLLGVQLEVTPELREGGLIDLNIIPKVKDLVGYDTYQIDPSYSEGSTVLGETTGSLPYYRIREMETNLTVADGSTIGMGGLIYNKLETFRDKVPVLGSIPFIGRLFRSEGEKNVKRNLMIFVTASQMDVKGRKSTDLALKK